jgi:DNA-binding transcriptional ArsR family regulator
MNAVFKALADPTRRKVLELLRQRPMTAGEHFPVSRPTMSAHFAVLREADLIKASKIGTSIIYQLKLSVLEDALLGFAQLLGVGTGERAPADTARKTEAGQIQARKIRAKRKQK